MRQAVCHAQEDDNGRAQARAVGCVGTLMRWKCAIKKGIRFAGMAISFPPTMVVLNYGWRRKQPWRCPVTVAAGRTSVAPPGCRCLVCDDKVDSWLKTLPVKLGSHKIYNNMVRFVFIEEEDGVISRPSLWYHVDTYDWFIQNVVQLNWQ